VGDLRTMLDLETTHVSGPQTLDMLEDAVVEMTHAFHGRHPLIYTGAFWRDTLGNPSRESLLASHPKILKCMLNQSFYGKNDGAFHPITSQFAIHAFAHVTVQQYAGDITGVPGVSGKADKDRLLGNLDITHLLM
jgi:hypothetical protein